MRIPLLGLVLALLAQGCASSSEVARHTKATPQEPDTSEELSRFASLKVENPTNESWDLILNGTPRGIIAPNGVLDFPSLLPGKGTVNIRHTALGLQHTLPFTLARGETVTLKLPPALSQAHIRNPNNEAIEVLVHGIRLGIIEAKSSADFSSVPAGLRSVLIRSTQGPSSARLEFFFPLHQVTTLVIPPLENPSFEQGPKAPKNQSLIRVHNGSDHTVTLTVSGQVRGPIAAKTFLDVVLSPGTHSIEVQMERMHARTFHSVTLQPNQAAEWVWQEP